MILGWHGLTIWRYRSSWRTLIYNLCQLQNLRTKMIMVESVHKKYFPPPFINSGREYLKNTESNRPNGLSNIVNSHADGVRYCLQCDLLWFNIYWFMKIGLRKWIFWYQGIFFSWILISKIDIKINLRIISKNDAAGP